MRKEALLEVAERFRQLNNLSKEEREEELYFLGVSLRNYFMEIDYVYEIFSSAYVYFKEVIIPESANEVEARNKFENYLRKIRVFEESVIPELVDIWFNYELYKVEYSRFKELFYEIKEKMKQVVWESIPDEIKSDIHFREGFGEEKF